MNLKRYKEDIAFSVTVMGIGESTSAIKHTNVNNKKYLKIHAFLEVCSNFEKFISHTKDINPANISIT